MTEFWCKVCADNSDVESECLCVGKVWLEKCVACGRLVDPQRDPYTVFRSGTLGKHIKRLFGNEKETASS